MKTTVKYSYGFFAASGVWTATARGVPGVGVVTGSGSSSSAALAELRASLKRLAKEKAEPTVIPDGGTIEFDGGGDSPS